MAERPKFFDDLAGVAGGAFSALAGLREEVESTIRARVDEVIRRMDLVKRDDLEAVQEMAAAARTGQERAEERLAALEARLAEMVTTQAVSTTPVPPHVGTGGSEAAPQSVPPAVADAGSPMAPPATS